MLRRTKIPAALFFFCVLSCAAVIPVSSTPAADANTDMVVPRVDTPVAIDGKLDEKFWVEASWRSLVLNDGSGAPQVGAEVAFAFDAKNFYVALKAQEPHPEDISRKALDAGDGGKLWNGEVVEWFIQPGGEGAYVQLAWNPANAKTQGRYEAPARVLSSQEISWETKTRVGTDGWVSEAAIPFEALGVKSPSDGDAWSVNLIRQRLIGGTEISALSPPWKNHHDPERFQSIWFGKVGAKKTHVKAGEGPVRALVGCYDAGVGYDMLLEGRMHLARVLGSDHVDVRLAATHEAIKGWPRSLEELQQYSLVVIEGLPAASFSTKQIEELAQYVEEGGHLFMMGILPEKGDLTWEKSALGPLLPAHSVNAQTRMRRAIAVDVENHPLFGGLPTNEPLTVWGSDAQLTPGGTSLAHLKASNGKDNWTFLSEKVTGKGSVLRMNAAYSQSATIVPVTDLLHGNDFCRSAFYPKFWDNLIRSWTGAHPQGATSDHATAAENHESKKQPLALRILESNEGDIFRPQGVILIKSPVQENALYPCKINLSVLAGSNDIPITLDTFALDDATYTPIRLSLPDLDAGTYTLEGVLIKDDKEIARARDRFSVAFPPTEKDEFPIGVIINPTFDETDLNRIIQDFQDVGFNMVTYLGGIVADSYAGQYRSYLEGLFNSRMQEAGIRTWPNWYPVWYYLLMPDGKGNYNYTRHDPAVPDWAFPGKEFLPWQSYWLGWFHRRFGGLPLTTGMVMGDEVTSTMLPVSKRLLESFQKFTGKPAPSPAEIERNSNLDFVEYRAKAMNDATWLTRQTAHTFEPTWKLASVITPNCFAGHSTCLIDVPGQSSAIGAVSVDEYNYGEPKFYQKNLKSLGVIWSGSDFGKLANVGLCAGNLNHSYLMDYPEQMFAGLSAGIHWLQIFCFNTAGFEVNGIQEQKFAEIARRTNREGGRIGRMLNHYERTKARAAVFYPHTAHLWLAAGQELNRDYLAMTGSSSQYLDLGYAFEAAFDVGRRLFGHLDVLFDGQIQRGDLTNYDVLILGYSKQTDEATLRQIRRFVERGGTLLVSSDSGALNAAGQSTDVLSKILPASVGAERSAPVDYSEVRMRNKEAWSRGHELIPHPGTEVLFKFPDGKPACVRGSVGRGEVLFLGMPLAALKGKSGMNRFELVEFLLNQRASLVSRPTDPEFSAITFRARRDHQRVFMIANHHKETAETEVQAASDESERTNVLVDVVSGERLPFEIKDGVLQFRVSCPDRWGRALAFLSEPPTAIELTTASKSIRQGEPFWLLVRHLRRDGLLANTTLPFDLEVKDPTGKLREDLSGVRVAENGVWSFHRQWPMAAQPGKWTARVKDPVTGATSSIEWEAH